jgi:ketosteroid isomerase-like protein
MTDDVELLKRVYALFNGREIESVLAAMHPDVVWANGMEGGHVHGRDEVCNYWKRQWSIIDPHVEPVEISANGEGEVLVKVHQVVRDPGGNLVADRRVVHVFQMRNGLIQRFDIRDG